MGGMKAVIWTDVVQAVVLVAGLLVVLWVLVSRVQGGIEEIIRVGLAQGPLQVDLSWGDWTTVSLWGVLVNGVVINMSQYGADQIVIQRYLTTPSARSGRKAIRKSCQGYCACIQVRNEEDRHLGTDREGRSPNWKYGAYRDVCGTHRLPGGATLPG